MENHIQFTRYKKLIRYIDESFKEDIDIQKVEEICHYSYRNINRIFQALHHETIGKYIKRIRLEKAAQYLKYDDANIADIAFEVGFEDTAAFSKAFKKRYHCSPSAFRNSQITLQEMARQAISQDDISEWRHIPFDIETLPEFEMLYLQYRGDYEDTNGLNSTWKQFLNYVQNQNLLNEKSILLTEILDDNEISDNINCRCNVGLVLENPLEFEPETLFNTKLIPKQKYAKFIHKGPYEHSNDTYDTIYARWLIDVKFEFADLPSLEFYLNDETNTPQADLITEIYIPIQ